MADNYNLERFVQAQESDYPIALEEIKSGRKKSHWIWYIFPQHAELGYSDIAKYYGIRNIEEAKAYLGNPVLRNHLIEISEALCKLDGDIESILGYPDNLKLRSCMTLFNYVDPSIDVFGRVLDKFYGSEKDPNTLTLIK